MSTPDIRANDLFALAHAATEQYSPADADSILQDPIIIVSAPRSGSNLLFEQLAKFPGFWTIGGESHVVYQLFPNLVAENAQFDSGRLDETHADPTTGSMMKGCFLVLLRDHRGEAFMRMPLEERPDHVTLLEKTPRNALNIRFLDRIFPGARYVYLYRSARQNVASLIEAWADGLQTGRFITFRHLPGWNRPGWCFLLPPGWRNLIGKPLSDIAAFQWRAANEVVLGDLGELESNRWMPVNYDDLVANPGKTLASVCKFAGIDTGAVAEPIATLPLSRTTLTPPDRDKWRKHEAEIKRLWPMLESTEEAIQAAVSGK